MEELLDKVPAYIHVEGENNRCYFLLTRDISGKWLAGYFTEGRYYHTVSEDTPKEALAELQKELAS